MSATPRTDAAKWTENGDRNIKVVLARFSEKLEQELTEAMKRAIAAEKALCDLWPFASEDYYPECATEPYRAVMEAARAIVEARKEGV